MEKTYVIRNRWTNEVIFAFKCASFKLCVEIAVSLGIRLYKANLSKANLSEANLSKADLSEADLSEANLSKADLYKANLSEANLSKADLYKANLSEANLSAADLSKTDLYIANLSAADRILSIQWRGFSFFVQKDKSRIGCEYRANSEWLKMDIETAVKLGIKREDYGFYRSLLIEGIKALGGDVNVS